MKLYFALISLLIASMSASAFATTYKCSSNSINTNVVRYEVEFSFDPLAFQFNTLFKEDDGSWSLNSETLADVTGILKPAKIQWLACQTKLNSSSSEISYDWSKDTVASGHLRLNLSSGTGEFLSSIESGDTVSRRIQFYDCVENISK